MEQPLAPCGGQEPFQSVNLALTPACLARTCQLSSTKDSRGMKTKVPCKQSKTKAFLAARTQYLPFVVLLPGKLPCRVSSLQMCFYLFLLLSLWAVFRAGHMDTGYVFLFLCSFFVFYLPRPFPGCPRMGLLPLAPSQPYSLI